jgi:hypothetical protein
LARSTWAASWLLIAVVPAEALLMRHSKVSIRSPGSAIPHFNRLG